MADVKATQLNTLKDLIEKARKTEYGKKYRFDRVSSYESFKKRVPMIRYQDIASYVERMKQGEKDVLWPGTVTDYAMSAGTTGGGKHIPLSNERLKSDQRFLRKVFFSFASQRTFDLPQLIGSHVSLPGNISAKNYDPQIRIGEISAYLAEDSPSWLARFQVRSPETMVQEEWDKKFERCLRDAVQSDVKMITATPSWILKFFQRALKLTGKQRISEIWPNLKLLICGGEAIRTHKPHFEQLCEGLNLAYIENYGASEGYFAFSDDLKLDDLHLVLDNDLFYEWIPNPKQVQGDLTEQQTVPTWQVEPGVPYAMVITNNSGLFRYVMNDVIEFTNVRSPRIKVRGRVSDMLDKFGEMVELYQAEEALSRTAEALGASYSIFTAGGLVDADTGMPAHYWFIHWLQKPDNMEAFAQRLDEELGQQSRLYSKRRGSGAIEQLRIFSMDKESIYQWQEEQRTVGAQTKIPKILHDEQQILHLRRKCEEAVVK